MRWTDEENFFWFEHVSSQIWCYLKLVRWRDEEWDEEMKKKFFWSEHVSSQIWCYLKLVRWRDEEWDEEMNRWRKFFGVWTCIKPNLVLSEISEMKRWRVRWRDEKKIFWSEHISSQISCYLKLVRWRVRWTDEQIKKFFFLVQTCIKPNLVLSEFSEMKRWRVRWTDEQMKKNFFWFRTCIKPNLVLSEISEMNRWTDEEKHVSSQIWCYLKLVRWRDEEWDEQMNRWRKIFFGPNMYQAKSGVIWN